MPTGYTYKLYEGPQEFQEFAMECARAFGACISLREEPSGTPIPEEFEPNGYAAKRLKEAKKELKAAKALTLEKAKAESEAFAIRLNADRQEQYRKEVEIHKRFVAMRAKALDYVPPTPEHQNFKKFMIEQLELGHYCDVPEVPKPYEAPSPEEWIKDHIEMAERTVKMYTEDVKQDNAGAAERTEWIRALRESLK